MDVLSFVMSVTGVSATHTGLGPYLNFGQYVCMLILSWTSLEGCTVAKRKWQKESEL
jgi:hypothetical protein